MDTEAVIVNDLDYPALCEKLSGQVIKLEQDLAAKSEYNAELDNIVSRQRATIEQFEEILKNAVVNDDIDSELAEIFASIFGFDLLQEVDLEITVTFRGTAKLPLNEVAEDFDWENELNFYCDSHWTEVDFELEDVFSVDVEVQ